MSIIWLTKMILSHLLTDFVLQRKSWIIDRRAKHFASLTLYLHTFITALVALLLIGFSYWMIAVVLFVTHTLIDGWKSYREANAKYFVIDQILHLIVIVICWFVTFYAIDEISDIFLNLNTNKNFWILGTAVFFLSFPCSIIIGEITKSWRKGLQNAGTLANAGRWIGMIERIVIFILILLGQYEAFGLLVAAKSIIRFTDNNRTEEKTEYLLIGTLSSICFAILTGLLVKYLLY